ncbi:MAG: IS66 family insertion sequence element accessory protein TnpA, partial [Gemmatimonadaceae bacterium]
MADRATWAKRVAAWRASGQSATKFCEGRDFA